MSDGDTVRGVAIVGRPVARMLADLPANVELTGARHDASKDQPQPAGRPG